MDSEAPLVTKCAREILQRVAIFENPYFKSLQDGSMSTEDFQKSQEQFFFAVVFFSRPMAALAGRIDNAKDRLGILENVLEEHGNMNEDSFHSSTFRKFLHSVAGTETEFEGMVVCPQVRAFNAVLTTACIFDEIEVGIGCMGIIELAFAEISSIVGNAVVDRGWIKRENLTHYNLHAEIDARHADDFFKIIEKKWHDPRKQYYIKQGLELGAYVFDRLYRDLIEYAHLLTAPIVVAILLLTSVLFSPAVQAQAKTNMLYGRVDEFKTPGGPSFPNFFSGEATDDEEVAAQWPGDIRGLWHGDIKVLSCHTADQCYQWDEKFARGWDLEYQQSRVGPGVYKFEKKGKYTELTWGRCVYRVPLRQDQYTYDQIIGKLAAPTAEQIALIDQSIAPVTVPVNIERGKKIGKDEILANGVSTHVETQRTIWRELSNNSWELDSVKKRSVHFPPPQEPSTIYTEGVTRVTLESDDTMIFETADARYSEDKMPLCYAVEAGRLSRGAGSLVENGGDVSITMLPLPEGVQLDLNGGFSNHVTVLIPGAKLKR